MVRHLLLVVLLALTACSTVDSIETASDLRLPANLRGYTEAVKERLDQQMTVAELSPRKMGDPSELIILQVNDVYEVEPSEAGTRGGLARFAKIRWALEKQFPAIENGTKRILAVLPGDFLSPSAIGASREQTSSRPIRNGPTFKKGEFVAGRHMIEGLRKAGMDIVSFGNHEFDFKGSIPNLPPPELINRIREFTAPRAFVDPSRRFLNFGTLENPKWLAGNVKLNESTRPLLPPTFSDADQPYVWETAVMIDNAPVPIKVGVISICVPWKSGYVNFEMEGGAYAPKDKHSGDVYASADRQIKILESKGVNLIIALTHQSMQVDREFAEYFRGRIHLIAGGHEHDRQFDVFPRGVKNEMPHLMVTKADANAKSAYVHRFQFEKVNGNVVPVSSVSKWISVDEKLDSNPEVNEVLAVGKTTKGFELQAKASFRTEFLTQKDKYAPNRVIWKTQNDLDGRESKIRSQKTHLSEVIGRSLAAKAFRLQKMIPNSGKPVIGAIYHGGTIRIDDRLMSPKALQEVSPGMFSTQTAKCEQPSNCRPAGNSRCEKQILCPGEITEYDVLRIAPFAETVLTWIDLSGKEIETLYGCNDQNSGTGSYLHFTNIFKCTENPRELCYLAINPEAEEFEPSTLESPIEENTTYTVASLDYFSHIAIPNHKGFKRVPTVYPTQNALINPTSKKKNPGWVLENDIRRILVEEPTKNLWVSKVITDTEIGKSVGFGIQPPNEPAKKIEACVYQ